MVTAFIYLYILTEQHEELPIHIMYMQPVNGIDLSANKPRL